MSLSPFLTIPGTSAKHVVGDTTVDLAHGDLSIIVPSMSNPLATAKTPVLMLTVDKAAFQLYSTTEFGTVAGDERVYVFKPELGEDVLGYVKLVLPDGVRDPGSEFNLLQERFEKILISRGLLKEGDGPNERSTSIPNVTAAHVVGDNTVFLATGDLALSTIPPNSNKDPKAILTLKVGSSVFTLHGTTLFGTMANNARVYLFKPEIQDTSLPEGGYITLTLPDDTPAKAQDKFEKILLDFGLLKGGVEAAGDEISRSVREDAAATASSIRKSTTGLLQDSPPTSSPVTFSPAAHKIAESGSSATGSVYTTAQGLSASVSSAAANAGAWVASRSGMGPMSPSTTAAVGTLSDTYNSVGQGAADIKHAVGESFGDVVQHELGSEARTMGEHISNSVGNVGGALGQVAEVGTAAVVVGGGVKGAVGLDDRADDEADVGDESIIERDEEMDTFAIAEKDEDGEWKDVDV